MNPVRGFVLTILVFSGHIIHAQAPAERALLYADSLINSYYHNNLDVYENLSYPGVISYYGGPRNFAQYIQRSKAFDDTQTHSLDKLDVIQMITRNNESQCVVQRNHESIIDDRKAVIVSYLVGQSLDGGITWKFFDVALNAVSNITWIMPDIFDHLSIPVRQVIYKEGTGP